MASKHIPEMDWASENVAKCFKIFKQRLELYFLRKNVEQGKQVAHILLQIGEKGLQMYNAMTLTVDQQKDPAMIFQKLGEQIEPSEHFQSEQTQAHAHSARKNRVIGQFRDKSTTASTKV